LHRRQQREWREQHTQAGDRPLVTPCAPGVMSGCLTVPENRIRRRERGVGKSTSAMILATELAWLEAGGR
jgi:hypothetical protein